MQLDWIEIIFPVIRHSVRVPLTISTPIRDVLVVRFSCIFHFLLFLLFLVMYDFTVKPANV